MPAGQSTVRPASGSVRLPTTQAPLEFEPLAYTNLPAGHAVHADVPEVNELYVPQPHPRHAAPAVCVKVPAPRQVEHTSEVTAPTTVPYKPDWQLVHAGAALVPL